MTFLKLNIILDYAMQQWCRDIKSRRPMPISELKAGAIKRDCRAQETKSSSFILGPPPRNKGFAHR
ncbi:MAG: hypothetical protein ACK4N4_06710 [Burkholderiales bacterium]